MAMANRDGRRRGVGAKPASASASGDGGGGGKTWIRFQLSEVPCLSRINPLYL